VTLTRDEQRRGPGPMVRVPDGLLGREVDLGETTVTPAMVAHYAAAVSSAELPVPDFGVELPAMFCLALRRGLRPELPLPAGVFGLYGGHDIEFYGRIRPGETYRTSARIADVYEKSGRSGVFTVVVREVFIRDRSGQLVAHMTEREILRPGPSAAAPPA
jgi:N-terminal half of MaoC dehydratase